MREDRTSGFPTRSVALCVSLLGLLGLAGVAQAQPRVRAANMGGGGVSSAGGVRHISAAGQGMAVGGASAGGVVARHGFLAGTGQRADITPPVIAQLPDITISTVADRCGTFVDLPPVVVSDDRDRRPVVTVTLGTVPEQNIPVAGGRVDLPLGSYDVLIEAVDRYGNVAVDSYRIDVVDQVPPVVDADEPTPVGGEVEAVSPAGTAVAINYACVDACDPAARGSRTPALARYGVGDTRVVLGCVDASGNEAEAPVTVRVRDTTAPVVSGAMPPGIVTDCNDSGGARVAVPQVVWQDNGYNANQITRTLVVDPGPGEQVFANVPATVTLSRGAHVLRFFASDPSGNPTSADLGVTIEDNDVPAIDVLRSPNGGWHRGVNDAEVVFNVVDGCGGFDVGLEINVQPPPVGQFVNGDQVTATYRDDGLYALTITARDGEGNSTADNSVAFGIDNTPPVAVVIAPAQDGVDVADPSSFPVRTQSESLAVNLGAEEDADGTFSGIAQVAVYLDPQGANVRLAQRDFPANGAPARGARAVGNVNCEANIQACDADDAIDLRHVPVGAHELAIVATDVAGNTSTGTARFRAVDLAEAMDVLRGRLEARLVDGIANPAARNRVQQARQQLIDGRATLAIRIAESTWNTPKFLGTGLVYAQRATTLLEGAASAVAAADPGLAAALESANDLLQRAALSDLTLMAEWQAGLRVSNDSVVRNARGVDLALADAARASLADAINARQYTQAISDAQLAFFHQKSALEGWMMNYTFVPDLGNEPEIMAEYGRGRDILRGIREELDTYLTLETKPAELNMALIRDRLNQVVQALDILVARGFDGNGLSDQAYVRSLMELRDVANFSSLAGNQGAWVRNYQFAMIQVVRYMTQTSMEDAIYWRGGGRRQWPIYVVGLGYVADGVGLLDNREVQAVIDLYGVEQDPVCLIVGVYHCDFLDDDEMDADRSLPEADVPDFCWDRIYRPSEWDDVGRDGQIPAWCRWEARN